jgi:hypothetical protein
MALAKPTSANQKATQGNINYISASDGGTGFVWLIDNSDPSTELAKLVKVADKADAAALTAGTADKWLDAAAYKGLVDALDAIIGVSIADKDLGTFTGTKLSDDKSIKAILQEVETALEAFKVTGRFIGSADTFATLPATATATGAAINGDWAYLKELDGTNLKGVYIYNGSVYAHAFDFTADISQLTDTQAQSTTDTTFGTTTGKQLYDRDQAIKGKAANFTATDAGHKVAKPWDAETLKAQFDPVYPTVYADSTALIAVDTTNLANGSLAYLEDIKEFVIFNSAAEGGDYTPTTGGGGWLKQEHGANSWRRSTANGSITNNDSVVLMDSHAQTIASSGDESRQIMLMPFTTWDKVGALAVAPWSFSSPLPTSGADQVILIPDKATTTWRVIRIPQKITDYAAIWVASTAYLADQEFSVRIPATGTYKDANGNLLLNSTLYNLAYPTAQTSGATFDVPEALKTNMVNAAAGTIEYAFKSTLANSASTVVSSGLTLAAHVTTKFGNIGIASNPGVSLQGTHVKAAFGVAGKALVVQQVGLPNTTIADGDSFPAGVYAFSYNGVTLTADRLEGNSYLNRVRITAAASLRNQTEYFATSAADTALVLPTISASSQIITFYNQSGKAFTFSLQTATDLLNGTANGTFVSNIKGQYVQFIANPNGAEWHTIVTNPASATIGAVLPAAAGNEFFRLFGHTTLADGLYISSGSSWIKVG